MKIITVMITGWAKIGDHGQYNISGTVTKPVSLPAPPWMEVGA